MNYREKFEMSDYSYNAFLKDMENETNLKVMNNSAELLLQAELITMSPIDGIEKSAPVSSLSFKTRLIDNYNYLIDNMEDFKVYPVGYLMVDALIDFLVLDFNKTHRN